MNLAALASLGKAAWTIVEPMAKTAGHVAGTVTLLYVGDKVVRNTGKLVGKTIDSARHLVGYEDNLFSPNKNVAKKRTSKNVAKKRVSKNVAKKKVAETK